MLFNSEIFVFAFLPTVWLGYRALQLSGLTRAAVAWLVFCSLVFYAWFEPVYVLLIISLIIFNYVASIVLLRLRSARRLCLGFAIAANLAVLGYYKYANFFIANVDALTGLEIPIQTILLPIGISFFTFQKIAYLVDIYRGKASEYNFLDFCLFVSFFPQLIAGPIVHHAELIPQFRSQMGSRLSNTDLAGGLLLFTIGLGKKVLLADVVASWANPVFAAAHVGHGIDALSAWCAVLAFTFQIYFDFSAYSDMALGLAMLFGIRLPMNFDSPYKATSIVDFWRRWHITLSRFLRDYVYIPLGGNRRGRTRRYVNLMLTMLIGGLWHGAAWTFVIWGGLHGLYLAVNHAWQASRGRLGLPEGCLGASGPWLARALTFVSVVAAWVFFRAQSLDAVTMIFQGLVGAAPAAATGAYPATDPGQLAVLLALVAGAMLLPNSLELTAAFRPAIETVAEAPIARLIRQLVTAPGPLPLLTGAAVGTTAVVILAFQGFNVARMQPFIYFQF